MAEEALNIQQTLQQAFERHQRGDLPAAEKLYRAILKVDPTQFDALNLLAALRLQQNKNAEARTLLTRALQQNPNSPEALYHRGLAFLALAKTDDALNDLDRAVALNPQGATIWEARGRAQAGLGQAEQALDSFDKALKITPEYPEALAGRGSALAAQQRFEEAIGSWQRARAFSPNDPALLNNLGAAWQAMDKPAEALTYFEQALAIDPRYGDALRNGAVCLKDLHRPEESIVLLDRLVSNVGKSAENFTFRANLLRRVGRSEEAIEDTRRAWALRPVHGGVIAELAGQSLSIADWKQTSLARSALARRFDEGEINPFASIFLIDDPDDQLRVARSYIAKHAPRNSSPRRANSYRHDKIRVAYLSADYRQHPVAMLIAEVIELHDRNAFEVTGVSFGPDDKSTLGARLRKSFDLFHDVRGWSDQEIAALLVKNEIDIAVDLTGHTEYGRPQIFTLRPAPVQVNYLGFPGTMGSSAYDYIIADLFIIPPEDQAFYTEKVVYLPDCYQANDRKRAIAPSRATRADAGLPEHGVVFCCFNAAFKITPAMFTIWMQLLKNVRGSVLWLLGGNSVLEQNLKTEARQRGVDPTRIVFAARTAPELHLARHDLADLFLDTLPYNAHTTTSDALWAGLPLLTCTGRTFAGRVAGSLLQAAGLPEVVTHSLDEYEALALKLANNPDQLGALRTRLKQNVRETPLFDTDRFRVNLEKAYRTMHDTAQRGEPPQPFAVS